jgi:hypothetical protein
MPSHWQSIIAEQEQTPNLYISSSTMLFGKKIPNKSHQSIQLASSIFAGLHQNFAK